jgi:hypothetical protein
MFKAVLVLDWVAGAKAAAEPAARAQTTRENFILIVVTMEGIRSNRYLHLLHIKQSKLVIIMKEEVTKN